MAQKNIHGDWSMSFENRILKSEVRGATNAEAARIWLKEAEEYVLSSPEGETTPWVVLNDCRQWNTTALDAWQDHNAVIDWARSHHCVWFATIFSKKIQRFAADNGFQSQQILHFYFDYDEAHQACLDKLREAHHSSKT